LLRSTGTYTNFDDDIPKLCIVYSKYDITLDNFAENRENMTFDNFRRIAYAMFINLREMHSRNICHRDIKPQNILLNLVYHENETIVDMGELIFCDLSDCSINGTGPGGRGTAGYLSPDKMLAAELCHESSDIWSAGVTLVSILLGENPFDGADVSDSCDPELDHYSVYNIIRYIGPIPQEYRDSEDTEEDRLFSGTHLKFCPRGQPKFNKTLLYRRIFRATKYTKPEMKLVMKLIKSCLKVRAENRHSAAELVQLLEKGI
jgi:serine/threonine protein kinase